MRPRNNAVLKNLAAEFQDEIALRAQKYRPYRTLVWLRSKGIRVHKSTLSRFLVWYNTNVDLAEDAGLTEALLEQISKEHPELSVELLNQIGQSIFTKLVIGRRDIHGWKITQELSLKNRKLELDWERFRDEARARKARLRAELQPAKTEGGLTDEAIKEITEKLKLM